MNDKRHLREKLIKTIEMEISNPQKWKWCLDQISDIAKGKYSADGSLELATQFSLMSKLAERGCLEAINRLGVLYFDGKGVEKNEDLAIKYFKKAAEGGFLPAKENLADYLLFGLDAQKDYVWGINMCFEVLNERANFVLFTIADCYDEGIGVKQNLNYSYYLYQMAVAIGYKPYREHAERKLEEYCHEGIKPLKHTDFYPMDKYKGYKFTPKDMKSAVYANIDFTLAPLYWYLIEKAFSFYWNDVFGKYYHGSFIDFGELYSNIKTRLKNCGMDGALPEENLRKIFDIMIEFSTSTKGVIAENKKEIYWDYDMDLIEYPSDAQLVTVISYVKNNNGNDYFRSVIVQLISHAKRSALVWSRQNDISTFSRELSIRLFNDADYKKHFMQMSTNRNNVHQLKCIDEHQEVADLYIIDDEFLNIFDFCTIAQDLKMSNQANYVFVDDMDFIEFPVEFMKTKKSRLLELMMLALKGLSLSLNIPVIIQKTVSSDHSYCEIIRPTLEESVPYREHIEEQSDRIVVVHYSSQNEEFHQNLTVVKDNKNSTGMVIMT